MKLHQIISTFLIALCAVQSLSCPEEITITPLLTSKTCKFFFMAVNQTCEFQKCVFQESSSEGAYTESWIQCFESCCGTVLDEIDISLSAQSEAKQCEAIFSSKTKTLLGVSIGVSFGVVSLFIVAIACIKYKCCLYRLCFRQGAKEVKAKAVRKELQVIRAARAQHPEDPTNLFQEAKSQQTSEKEFIKAEDHSLKLLTYDIKSNPQLLYEKCRVCKQPKVSCFLSCNHYFHIECIGRWLLEERCCASCGSDRIKYIHIFCTDCRVKLKVQQVQKFRASFRKRLTFRCSECQQRP